MLTETKCFAKGLIAALRNLNCFEEVLLHKLCVGLPVIRFVGFPSLIDKLIVYAWYHDFLYLHHFDEGNQRSLSLREVHR